MFILTKETLPSFRNQVKYQLNNYHNLHNIWREVEEYWYDYHSKIIESKINMDGLLQTLQISNGDNPINWLNSYIKFLKDNSTIVEKRKIFPDQNGNFKFLKDLRYDDSIPEILKDLYNNLIRRIKKNNNEDNKNTLLAKEITCYIGYNRQSSKEIIERYETLFNTSKDEEIKTKIAEDIIILLPIQNNIKKFQTINSALKDMITIYNELFNKNLSPVEINNTAELNYILFVKHILIQIFRLIENMDKNTIISKINIIPKAIKFAWDYQFDENFTLSIDPKKYKIFINQNNRLIYSNIFKMFI